MLVATGAPARPLRRRGLALGPAATWLLLATWPHPAPAQLLGPEFQVNSFTPSAQYDPAVAADGSGNFVVVWTSFGGQDGSAEGVFGQRFNSAGTKMGSEFQVNTFTTGYQISSAVSVDGLGNFIVVWQSIDLGFSNYRVFGQRFDSVGSAVGSEFQVNTDTTFIQRSAVVAADVSGNFVVVWNSLVDGGASHEVIGQRYDSVGSEVGSEFVVNTYTTGFQVAPAVAMDGSGNFVVAWASYEGEGSGLGVFGQRFDSAGSKLGSQFQVNSHTANAQDSPAVAADGSGDFVVVWRGDDNQDGSLGGVFGQRFDSAGSRVGSEFQVNTYTTENQLKPAVAADGAGNFLVSWQSDYQDGSYNGVFAQSFSSAGEKVGSEFQVNAHTTNQQRFATVAADGAGHFVVAWQGEGHQDGSSYGVFGRQVTPLIFSDGFNLGGVCAWSASVGAPAC